MESKKPTPAEGRRREGQGRARKAYKRPRLAKFGEVAEFTGNETS